MVSEMLGSLFIQPNLPSFKIGLFLKDIDFQIDEPARGNPPVQNKLAAPGYVLL